MRSNRISTVKFYFSEIIQIGFRAQQNNSLLIQPAINEGSSPSLLN